MVPWLVRLGPGCLEFLLNPIESVEPLPQRVAVEETFVQAPLPKADLLLVIDDTASMAQEQQALADDFAVLLDELDERDIGWQLGAVSTEMVSDDAGWLRGTPWILTPDVPNRNDAFAAMIQVGTDGSGPEAGLAAAATALAFAADGPNAGFRRPDALLNVIFLSDTDDHSDAWLGDDPVGAFLDRLAAETDRTGLPARASGIVGPPPSGCNSLTGTARPAVRYTEAIEATGGVGVSICAVDFALVLASLSEASIAWRTDFELRNEPISESVRVRVNGERVDEGWMLLSGPPGIRFDQPPPPESRIDVDYFVSLDAG